MHPRLHIHTKENKNTQDCNLTSWFPQPTRGELQKFSKMKTNEIEQNYDGAHSPSGLKVINMKVGRIIKKKNSRFVSMLAWILCEGDSWISVTEEYRGVLSVSQEILGH